MRVTGRELGQRTLVRSKRADNIFERTTLVNE